MYEVWGAHRVAPVEAAEALDGPSLRGVEPFRARLARLLFEREILIKNLQVRIHSIIEMIWWTSLVPWEFEFPPRRRSLSRTARTPPVTQFKVQGSGIDS